jgi:spore germination protein YaaH
VTDPPREDVLRLARRRSATTVLAVLLLGSSAIPATATVGTPAIAPAETPAPTEQDAADLRPGIHWEEAQAHAHDKLDLPAGGRVTVGFSPRADDRWTVGGGAPRALPEGRRSGRELRDAMKNQSTAPAPAVEPSTAPTEAPAEPTAEPSTEAITESTAAPSTEPTAAPTEEPSSLPEPEPSATATDTPVDQPIVDESEIIAAEPASWTSEAAPAASVVQPAAVISSTGLRREVFGFLPYWELSDSSTTLDYSSISTIAYFGVGASATGTFEDTPGWTGWTSAALTNLINSAHQNHTRVVLTVQSFAWSTGGATKQKALLGSATARATLARNIAMAIRDRGADGVNLDFEPLAAGYADEFVLLVKRIRTELDAVAKGYQLTFDTTGYIGNYPLEEATAAGAADAIFIMGYDYRSAGSSPVGSIAPIGGPTYDITETVLAYKARVPASKLILGVPYYGRAWSTNSDQLHATNISGTKYGASTTVIYATGIGVLQEHGKRYDPGDGVAWTAYRRENCSATYGCVTSWRQLYLDDAAALRAKYDIVNNHGLRGAGIWALGYDNARPELWAALKDKFVSKMPFTDVHDFVIAIEWLYTSGITYGCTPTLFCPTANVTRAQLAMFLDRALDLPDATTDYFDDDDGKTGEASINALAKAGITAGCGPRRFCPTANVSRAEMAMFLDRALDLPSATTDYFDDDDGRTGEGSINALAASAITGGCGTRRYCPAASVTREQMAAFLYRAHVQGRID